MSYKTQRKFKIRYDRIISVIVIFILAVYVVKQLFGNEVKEEIPTLASGSDSEEFKPVIYLSPSNQTDNAYASGDTTEAKAMRSVSDSARKYLEQNGITVYTAGEDYSLQEKVEFANENNVTAQKGRPIFTRWQRQRRRAVCLRLNFMTQQNTQNG